MQQGRRRKKNENTPENERKEKKTDTKANADKLNSSMECYRPKKERVEKYSKFANCGIACAIAMATPRYVSCRMLPLLVCHPRRYSCYRCRRSGGGFFRWDDASLPLLVLYCIVLSFWQKFPFLSKSSLSPFIHFLVFFCCCFVFAFGNFVLSVFLTLRHKKKKTKFQRKKKFRQFLSSSHHHTTTTQFHHFSYWTPIRSQQKVNIKFAGFGSNFTIVHI